VYYSELKRRTLIGQGYFGEVYEGEDPLHKKVAVKTLKRPSYMTQHDWEAYQDKLVNEAQSLLDAKHRNVVNVLHVVRSPSDHSVHVVLEFCGGGCLEDEHKRGPISVLRLRKVITDVCSGLTCIHNHGMIHRDIKPGNILSSSSRWKIGDFGLVTADLAYGYASMQGYLDHLPPESHRDRITSVKSDIWALGMTIYRLLHGMDFYQRVYSCTDIPDRVLRGGFATKLPWLPHVPVDWRRFVRRAMHDDPSRRFETALQMSQAAGGLSTEPDWSCTFTADLIRWVAPRGSRTLEVVWEIQSPNKHQWWAKSTGGIRPRKLGGSTGILNRTQVVAELEDFFKSRA
jgi:eukaryotic-like serine/threonine-protein kinase